MAIWNRKPKTSDADLAKLIAEEVSKAINNPYAAAGGAVVPSMPGMPSGYAGGGGQGLLQTPGAPAMPLPRPADAFGSQLGPAMPYLPAPLDPVFDDSGRALPRKYEYEVAWNLNLTQQVTPWAILKGLAEQCDIVHRCIEVRTAEMIGLEWEITVSDQAISQIMQERNCGHAKANQIARDQYSDEIARLKQFWEAPYVHPDRGFAEWLTEALWNHFVYDAMPIYPRYNLGRDVIGFDIIDGATIKPLLDNRGDIPHAPSPAFQQVLWGFPRGEYQASKDSDGDFFTGQGPDGEYIRDQLAYFVKNRRTWSPYGYSSVEMSIPMATLYLERQQWLRAEYTEGTMPTTFMKTDSEELDHLKLASLERVLNDTLTGQTAERHRIKMLPKSFDPVFAPTIDERYKDTYDEFIIKRVASMFGVQPTQLGIIPRTGLGGKGQQEGEQDNAELMSKKPLEKFIADCINSLNRRFLGGTFGTEFVFSDEGTSKQQLDQAKALQMSLYSGQKTLNDVQAELGQPLYDMPEADEPFIVAGNAITFLKGMLETDTAGETTAQVGTEGADDTTGSVGNAPIAPPKPDEPKPEEPKPEEIPLETKSTDVEMKSFKSFVNKRKAAGKWRDFVFETVDAEVAKVLNEQAQADVLKKKSIQAGRRVTYQVQTD